MTNTDPIEPRADMNETTDTVHIDTKDVNKVDRIEVIDDTGRAYVKGSIYGSPVKVELSYQDDGRTLKIFVSPRTWKEE